MAANPHLEYRTGIVVVHPGGLALTGGPRSIDWQDRMPLEPYITNAVILVVDGEPVAASHDRYLLTVPR